MTIGDKEERIQHERAALERHPEIFSILGDYIDVVNKWVHGEGVNYTGNSVHYIKTGLATRALNLIRSIRLLTENDHWEDGAILTRSLFEILINTEEILRDDVSAEERAQCYLKFGELQKYLNRKNTIEYDIQRGSFSGDANLFRELDAQVPLRFKEFLLKSRRGKSKNNVRWANSWCGKTVKELANVSKNPMRAHQYRIIYSFTSNFAHGGPIVLSSVIFHGEDFEQSKAEFESSEEKNIVEFVSLAISFCTEIFLLVGDVFPEFDPGEILATWPRIRELLLKDRASTPRSDE